MGYQSNGALIFLQGILFFALNFMPNSAEQIRGVSITNQGFYNPSQEFTCLDGSLTLPFSSVNDDYCDCPDGSDEPGTSACPEGKFHCTNSGHRSKDIQSSRVNDGICDCCDGSDEYDSSVACFNDCKEQGKASREENKRQKELQLEGYKIREDYARKGKEKKTEQKQKLETLNKMLEERRTVLEGLKAKKEEVETPEKAAKDKHQQEWDEELKRRQELQDQRDKNDAFTNLDANNDGSISVEEVVSNHYLSADLEQSEAQDFLQGAASVDINAFDPVWDLLKPKYVKEGRPAKTEETTDAEKPAEESPAEETKEEEEETAEPPVESPDASEDGMPPYSEETQQLITVADEARKQFEEVEKAVKDGERELKTLEDVLNQDFGQEEEYEILRGQCFELTDLEYTYKMCPFDKVTQRPKAGGGETDLGKWNSWIGSPNKHSGMKFDGGQGCWNGPSRSTHVSVLCGAENTVLKVSEPSKCEYAMDFMTPAMCAKIDAHPHEEL